MDLHGHGHNHEYIELGYRLTADHLNAIADPEVRVVLVSSGATLNWFVCL